MKFLSASVRLSALWVSIVLFLLSGCIEVFEQPSMQPAPQQSESAPVEEILEEPAEQVAPLPDPLCHFVQWPGETLSIISMWYTGKIENWKALAQANPQINPHLLYLKTWICIPDELILTREPMPRDFLDQFSIKEKKQAAPGISTPSEMPAEQKTVQEPVNETKDDDIPLFGPKTFNPE